MLLGEFVCAADSSDVAAARIPRGGECQPIRGINEDSTAARLGEPGLVDYAYDTDPSNDYAIDDIFDLVGNLQKMAEVHGNRTHLPRGQRAAQRF